MRASIVLGLNYGDEGKGLTVDYLCSQDLAKSKSPNSIVVRFSGGQQAGHTVLLPNGKKHISSNFGSGVLRGIPTYFTEHTTFYPVTIYNELKKLNEIGITDPELIFHPLAKLTTPYDVFANRIDKNNLDNGTCGLGIGKTMQRSKSPYKLYVVDLVNESTLVEKLEFIRNHYYSFDKTYVAGLANEVEKFAEAVIEISRTIKWRIATYGFLAKHDHIIFEGSQGILLDMDHGQFPHVTYANTTSKNAMEILDYIDCKDRHMYYVTRRYLTRHGNGPFLELPIALDNNDHETNVNNDWQGRFKLGQLDYDKINFAIRCDEAYSDAFIQSVNLMITCCDQYDIPVNLNKINRKFDHIYRSWSAQSGVVTVS